MLVSSSAIHLLLIFQIQQNYRLRPVSRTFGHLPQSHTKQTHSFSSLHSHSALAQVSLRKSKTLGINFRFSLPYFSVFYFLANVANVELVFLDSVIIIDGNKLHVMRF